MKTCEFEGVLKPLRRGGWSAKAILTTERHGQLFEIQLGPREFGKREIAEEWLHHLAAERSIDAVQITARSDRIEPPMQGQARDMTV